MLKDLFPKRISGLHGMIVVSLILDLVDLSPCRALLMFKLRKQILMTSILDLDLLKANRWWRNRDENGRDLWYLKVIWDFPGSMRGSVVSYMMMGMVEIVNYRKESHLTDFSSDETDY